MYFLKRNTIMRDTPICKKNRDMYFFKKITIMWRHTYIKKNRDMYVRIFFERNTIVQRHAYIVLLLTGVGSACIKEICVYVCDRDM